MAVMRGLLPLVALAASAACAQSLEQAAVRLANRVAKAEPAAVATVAVENRSALPAATVERIRAIVSRELRRFQRNSDPAVPVTFTIAENAAGPLLIAEIQQGHGPAVFIERFNRPEPIENKYRATLRLREIRTQLAPMLDFCLAGDTLAVLEPEQISIYKREQDRWKAASALPLVLSTATPRDARGRLLMRPPFAEVHVPGTVCTAAVDGPATVNCRGEDLRWREAGMEVAWVPRRNLLTSSAAEDTPFYTAAALPGGRTLIATLQGGLNLAPNEKLGADLAGIAAACSQAAVIVTSRGIDSDMVQAMDFSDAQPRPLTEALRLSGPVVALWAAETPEEVSVVVRNAKTGEYEASRLSVACDR